MKSMRMLAEEATSLQQTSSYPYGKEKDKNRITEISIEIRVREEEIGRSKSAIESEMKDSKYLETELETAKSKGKKVF